MKRISSSFSGPPIETEDDKGIELDEATAVDHHPPCCCMSPGLVAWESFGQRLSALVFGRVERPETMLSWLDSQELPELVTCDVPRLPCYSLDRQSCSVGSSADCRSALGAARLLFVRRSIP
jgi:hypothetical protein